jgi:hypothetical protein
LLRMLFGESPRQWTGKSLETVKAIEAFIRRASELADKRPDQNAKLKTYAIWAEGLLRSMDELEQSRYAAKRFAAEIRGKEWNALSEEERLNYERHVYFDKNTYIRLFALLDKLGTLLNDLLDLRTQKIKAQFSYFTVLRNMRQYGLHEELAKPLGELKEKHQEAFSRLRNRRNVEIHRMNEELQDDLRQLLRDDREARKLEDLCGHLSDSDSSWDMVEDTLGHSFEYAIGWLRRME